MTELTYGAALWDPPNSVVMAEFKAFIADHAGEYTRLWDELFSELHPRTDPSIFPGYDVCAPFEYLSRCDMPVDPYLLARLGDGEGAVLSSIQFESTYPNLVEYTVKRISDIVFGDPSVVWNHRVAISGLISEAAVQADILGIARRDFIQRRLFMSPAEKIDVRAVVGVIAQIQWLHANRTKLNCRRLVRPWVSRELFPCYRNLIASRRSVAVITGNAGLGAKLKDKFGSDVSVSEIVVPTQRAMRTSKDPRNTHYPDRYQEVCELIPSFEKGTLILVAAGLMGKSYCAICKANGCSSIDIGHVADVWEGRPSRPGFPAEEDALWYL